jgi:hypothetical protein
MKRNITPLDLWMSLACRFGHPILFTQVISDDAVLRAKPLPLLFTCVAQTDKEHWSVAWVFERER